jgi:hypothetical protein
VAEREWSETDSKDDAVATATHAAVTGKQYRATHVQASFSAAPSSPVLLQIKDGTTVVWEGYVALAEGIDVSLAIPGTLGNLMSATLAASGTGGRVGKVNIQGTEF